MCIDKKLDICSEPQKLDLFRRGVLPLRYFNLKAQFLNQTIVP